MSEASRPENAYTEEEKLALKTIIAFRRAEKVIRIGEGSASREFGITPIQFGVLETLYSFGEQTTGELMEKLLATPGNMTVVVKNLCRDGYISRRADEADRRKYVLSLSEKGRRLITELLPVHAREIRKTMSVLSADDKRELIRILQQFYKS